MPRRRWSRREILQESLAGGVLIATAGWAEVDILHAWMEAQTRRPPTPQAEMGPFYKKRAPSNTMLRSAADAGLPLAVAGRVMTTNGDSVPNATVEIWQADHGGLYDLDGYRFRASIKPPASGAYAFESVMPGHYPARVARHVHYFVTAPGCKPLVTQLYFATDEVFEGNPDKNFTKDPLITSRELVRPVTLTGTTAAPGANVTFELVLEKA
jgi:protocatechuate 3,4-dioxygenase beta subunit